jgi:hypothetical protein
LRGSNAGSSIVDGGNANRGKVLDTTVESKSALVCSRNAGLSGGESLAGGGVGVAGDAVDAVGVVHAGVSGAVDVGAEA